MSTSPRNRAFYSLLLLVFIPAIARNSSQKWGILPSNLTHFAQQSHSPYNAISTLLFHEVSYFTHYYGRQYPQQGHLPAPIKTHFHHELSLYLSKPTFPIAQTKKTFLVNDYSIKMITFAPYQYNRQD